MKLKKEDFTFFKRRCDVYLEVLGLQSWRVSYLFTNLKDNYGECTYDYGGRSAVIKLSNYWSGMKVNKREQLNSTALHEVLELLLCPLGDLAKVRTYDAAEYEKENHMVIRTLENVFKRLRRYS